MQQLGPVALLLCGLFDVTRAHRLRGLTEARTCAAEATSDVHQLQSYPSCCGLLMLPQPQLRNILYCIEYSIRDA